MSTRRHAIIFYGFSLKNCNFDLVEQLEAVGLDVVADHMCGDFMLVGKQILDYSVDSYDSEDEPQGVAQLELSQKEKTEVNTKLYSATKFLKDKCNETSPQLLFAIQYL